jgi:hypothetical protein
MHGDSFHSLVHSTARITTRGEGSHLLYLIIFAEPKMANFGHFEDFVELTDVTICVNGMIVRRKIYYLYSIIR